MEEIENEIPIDIEGIGNINTTNEIDDISNTSELEKKEVKLFNAEDVKFDDEKNFNGYNLDKFKEDIDYSEESVKALEIFTSKYKELGLSQNQVEGIIELMIKQGNQATDPETIKNNLNKNLTYDEKRNYHANCNILKNILTGTEVEKYYNAITSDPTAVKVLSQIVKYFQNGKDVNGIKEKEQRNISQNLTADEGIQEFNEYLKKGGKDLDKKRNEIRSRLLNKDEIDYFNQITE